MEVVFVCSGAFACGMRASQEWEHGVCSCIAYKLNK